MLSLFSIVSNTILFVFVSIFWISSSPSVSLICVVIFVLESSVLVFSLKSISGLPILFLLLVIVGGLFVLFSLIILTYPIDLEMISVSPSRLLGVVVIMGLATVSVGSWISWTQPSYGFCDNLSSSISSLGCGFHEWALVAILFLLLLFLFIIDSMVNHNGGTILFPNA